MKDMVPGTPPAIDAVLSRALERDPAKRAQFGARDGGRAGEEAARGEQPACGCPRAGGMDPQFICKRAGGSARGHSPGGEHGADCAWAADIGAPRRARGARAARALRKPHRSATQRSSTADDQAVGVGLRKTSWTLSWSPRETCPGVTPRTCPRSRAIQSSLRRPFSALWSTRAQ